MRLETRRLVLRDFEADDWQAMLRIEGDAETVRWQSYAPRTEDDCRAYIARDLASREDRTCFDLAVVLAETGAFVGRVGLDVKKPERAIGELWFVLDRALWGRGLMPEAAKAMLDLGFRELGLHRIFLDCDPRNRGAVRLAEKLGMTREAHLRESFFAKGEWSDSLLYAILAREHRT